MLLGLSGVGGIFNEEVITFYYINSIMSYPSIIILNKFVRLSKSGMAVTVILTTVFSGIEVMGSVLKVKAINSIMALFIGGDSGFFWINIAVLGIVLSLLLRDKIKGASFEV